MYCGSAPHPARDTTCGWVVAACAACPAMVPCVVTAPSDIPRIVTVARGRSVTTYGAIHAARGALAVRVVTDRPLATVTILGMSDGAVTTQGTMAGQAAQAATTQPQVVSRAGWGAD